MKVATRLNLAVLPAIVGLGVLAALAYWGDRGRQAPELVVMLAMTATVGSSLLSWRSTRFVSRRVGDLATEFRGLGLDVALEGAVDEFEELERVRESVRALASDQARLRETAARAIRQADAARQTHDRLLEQVANTVATRLEEARLALHILQTSPFGDLNENQDELVSAARTASEAADLELRRFARLVGMQSNRRAATRESVSVRALLDPVLAMITSDLSDHGITLTVAIAETVAPVLVDRLAAQEALSLLFGVLAEQLQPASELRLDAVEAADSVTVVSAPGLPEPLHNALPVLLARALLEAQAGSAEVTTAALRLRFPVPPLSVWRRMAHSVQHASAPPPQD